MDLQGKVAVVTGAGGNIGSACARVLAAEGARVVASDLPGTALPDVVAAIGADGGDAVALEADLTDEAQVAGIIAAARDHYGGLDALVNVAGETRMSERDRDLETMDASFWDWLMAVNVRSAMLGCKHALPVMLEGGAGSIVNFASTAALLGDNGLFAYSTSKAALIGFTRCVATRYGKRGIRCNAVAPGSVWGEATMSRIGPERLAFFEGTRLTPRLGVPDDIAHMVAYLSSDKSTYVTGQTLVVDGGGTAHQPWVGPTR
jgi:NAD(P)-dependent dehydrogenase (short-subunit alcohol dehydrogenase family)